MALATAGTALAADAGTDAGDAHQFTFTSIDGKPLPMAQFKGKTVLVVNTASQCGFTPQYSALEAVYKKYKKQGLVVLGVPSNDFGGQEPGGAADIKATANHVYGVTFPIAEKAVVKGANPHPFYKWAASERPHDLPRWNFHKYLIGRDGHIAAVFATEVEPTDPRMIAAIEKELASGE
jgi:glutathione peroxidase